MFFGICLKPVRGFAPPVLVGLTSLTFPFQDTFHEYLVLSEDFLRDSVDSDSAQALPMVRGVVGVGRTTVLFAISQFNKDRR